MRLQPQAVSGSLRGFQLTLIVPGIPSPSNEAMAVKHLDHSSPAGKRLRFCKNVSMREKKNLAAGESPHPGQANS